MVQIEQPQVPHLTPAQVGRRIMRATGALMVIQVIIKGFGVIEKSILGHLFGTSYLTDAYNAAKEIAFYVFQLVDQVVMHSFLPVFVQRMREHGEKDAWRLASTTINLLIVLMAAIAILGVCFAPHVLPLFVPNWFEQPEKYPSELIPLTVKLMRAMLVAVVFLTTTSFTYCLLNSYKQFALPASADLALKGAVLVFAVLFAKSWGPYALAAGFVLGAVAKLAVHSAGLGRRFLHYRPVAHITHPGLKQFGLLALPLILGTFVSIARQVMDSRFTSSLPEGSLSALKFARQLCDTPVQFFPLVFGIALFPFLADIAAAGDKARLRGMLMTATRMMVLIFIPLAFVLILLREPIIFMLFGDKSMAAANPLPIYALGMLIGALEIIVLQFYYAMSDTLRPLLIGALLTPLHITVAYFGVYHLGWGVMAIALALFVYKGAKVSVLYTVIRGKLGALEGRRTLVLLAKMLAALLPLAAILLLAVHYLPHPTDVEGKAAKLLALLPYMVAGGASMLAYLGVLHALRVEEVALLVAKVRGKLKKTPLPTATV